MRARKKVFIGCSFAVFGGICGVVLFILFGMSSLIGLYSDSPWDRAKLRAMCDPVRAVPIALEDHLAKHGEYPKSIEDLDPALPNSGAAKKAFARTSKFRYSSYETGYSIYRKLNWDGGIVYSSLNPSWVYATNDDVEWPIY